MTIDPRQLFEDLHPGFFERPYIRSLPENEMYEEMILPLASFSPDALPIPVPEGISFGVYQGDREALLRAVRAVEEDWAQYFRPEHRVFCAMDGETVASFCIVEPMKPSQGLRIAGPGCVGTVPAYRKKGIGLRMVQLATALLKNDGYDLSYIHFTHVAPWYARLGYQTVLRWDRRGLLP